ncbi:EpsG family protein [Chitinophaga sp. 22536]|uniref:EpsG family protein n=1 Tax=unclassified Chitinophaga TaxID=2619133 RepID=UPI003F830901
MVYYLLFALLASFSIVGIAKLSKSLYFFIFCFTVLALTLLVGLRGAIDPDYPNYQNIFSWAGGAYSSDLNIEIGYFYLNKLLYILGAPFQAVIFVMALLSVIPKVVFFQKYSPNYLFSVLVYYSTIFFLLDFIAIRQAVTLSIFMCCLPYILERRFFPYFLWILLAAQIHISAYILIPGYFFFGRRYNKTLLYLIVGICTAINLLKYQVPLVQTLLGFLPIPEVTAAKVNVYSGQSEFAFVSAKQLLLAFAFIYIRDKSSFGKPMLNLTVNLFVLGVLFATLFNGLPELSYRFKWYFFWAESLLIVYLIHYLFSNKFYPICVCYLFLFLIYLYSMNNFISEVASRGDYFFPYKTFLQF